MMTDPIADMLTRLRNANSAFHETVEMPHSKLKSHIAEILKQEGYIAGFVVTDPPDDRPGKVLTLNLKYGASGASPGFVVCPSRAFGCTPSRRGCRRCSVVWARRSSRRHRAC